MDYKKYHISQQQIFANSSVQISFITHVLIKMIDPFKTLPYRNKCLSYLCSFFLFPQNITKSFYRESVWIFQVLGQVMFRRKGLVSSLHREDRDQSATSVAFSPGL